MEGTQGREGTAKGGRERKGVRNSKGREGTQVREGTAKGVRGRKGVRVLGHGTEVVPLPLTLPSRGTTGANGDTGGGGVQEVRTSGNHSPPVGDPYRPTLSHLVTHTDSHRCVYAQMERSSKISPTRLGYPLTGLPQIRSRLGGRRLKRRRYWRPLESKPKEPCITRAPLRRTITYVLITVGGSARQPC